MNTITHRQALQMIRLHGGTIFGVKYFKKDGELRTMACKLHASKRAEAANKTGRKQGPNKDPFMVKVLDMNAKDRDGNPGAFRTINVATLIELKIGQTEFKVGN